MVGTLFDARRVQKRNVRDTPDTPLFGFRKSDTTNKSSRHAPPCRPLVHIQRNSRWPTSAVMAAVYCRTVVPTVSEACKNVGCISGLHAFDDEWLRRPLETIMDTAIGGRARWDGLVA